MQRANGFNVGRARTHTKSKSWWLQKWSRRHRRHRRCRRRRRQWLATVRKRQRQLPSWPARKADGRRATAYLARLSPLHLSLGRHSGRSAGRDAWPSTATRPSAHEAAICGNLQRSLSSSSPLRSPTLACQACKSGFCNKRQCRLLRKLLTLSSHSPLARLQRHSELASRRAGKLPLAL